VWFDPTISSRYSPRSTIGSLAKQFFRYGRGRAATIKKHPSAVRARQLAAPLLVIGLVSPIRRPVALAYLGVLSVAAFQARSEGPAVAVRMPAVLTAMHVSWGIGLLVGTAWPFTESRVDASREILEGPEGVS
jgi:hypothetical protein